MNTNTIVSIGILITLLCLSGSIVFAQVLSEDLSGGGELFVRKGCMKCHALNGVGGKVGPDLGKIDLGDTQLNLDGKIWNHSPSMNIEMGRAGMTKSTLTGQEFTEISAYLYFLKFFEEPGNPVQGRSVFSEKGCISATGSQAKAKRVHLASMNFQRIYHPLSWPRRSGIIVWR